MWSDSITDNPRTLVVSADTSIMAIFDLIPAEIFSIDTIRGSIDGHEYIGLGLPSNTLWATCNIGADKPQDAGSYFAWGETEAKNNYDWKNYKFMAEGEKSWKKTTKYQIDDSQSGTAWYDADGKFIGDNKNTLDIDDDAACANWSDNWNIPTNEQWQELCDGCYWVWTDNYNGAAGFIVYAAKTDTDKGDKILPAMNTAASDLYSLSDIHIFLPAAGSYSGSTLTNDGTAGSYWTCNLSEYCSGYARYISISGESGIHEYDFWRNYGRSIRAVRTLID